MRRLAALSMLVPVALAGACGGSDAGGSLEDSVDPAGAMLFVSSTCGDCHTLDDAGTSGTTGPNLDERAPTAERARIAMETGPGLMVPFTDRLTPQQIEQLAVYVDAATG